MLFRSGFGRVIHELVEPSAGGTDLYTIDYTFVDNSGCSSGGGTASSSTKVKSRRIADGATTETTYMSYDLLGRIPGQGTTSSARPAKAVELPIAPTAQ